MADLSCSPYSSLGIKVKLKVLLQWATNLLVQNVFAECTAGEKKAILLGIKILKAGLFITLLL